MGTCVHCGQSAGWFRSSHPLCQANYEKAMAAKVAEEDRLKGAAAELVVKLTQQIRSDCPMTDLFDTLEHAIESGLLVSSDRQSVAAKAWSAAVDAFLEDGLLSTEEDDRLARTREALMLSPQELSSSGALMRAGKASVLRAALEGAPILHTETDVPVNMQRGEGVAWVFRNVDYLEDRVKRQMVGGSQGVSLRVMSGVYYRVGQFKGKTVETTQRQKVDTGSLVVTNKHLYFVGPATSKKIPYSKIVSFEQFSDGIGLMRDAATAKPQIFVVDDGWFAYNLITNLARSG